MCEVEPLDWDIIEQEEIIQSKKSCKDFQVSKS